MDRKPPKARRATRAKKAISTVAIVAKTASPMAVEFTKKAAQFLIDRGVEVIGDPRTAEGRCPPIKLVSEEALGQKADLIVVLGGDGTFIRACSMIGQRRVPVFGVNMGALGFLTEITREEIFTVLSDVLCGRFRCEERIRLRASIVREGKRLWRQDVLNEVVVLKNAMSPMIHVDVSSDGVFVSRFRGDGLMMATPTGSTAYNLAADGPIVFPTLRCILVTPISPHMLADRPIVLADTAKVSMRIIKSRGQTFANLDGLRGFELGAGDEVMVEASPDPVCIVVSPARDYFNILRTKLKWGEQ
jgi:NAD+ kinase